MKLLQGREMPHLLLCIYLSLNSIVKSNQRRPSSYVCGWLEVYCEALKK